MGYTTDFQGVFELDKPLTPEHQKYLYRFADIRHMRRDPKVLDGAPDPVREAVGLPLGPEGMFYVGEDDGNCGQSNELGVLDYNMPPGAEYKYSLPKYVVDPEAEKNCCPGLWCQWIPVDEESHLPCEGIDNLTRYIGWDGGEKFYRYVEWLEFLIRNFLEPWGYKLNGAVKYRGEDFDDFGTITVKDNEVSAMDGSF